MSADVIRARDSHRPKSVAEWFFAHPPTSPMRAWPDGHWVTLERRGNYVVERSDRFFRCSYTMESCGSVVAMVAQ